MSVMTVLGLILAVVLPAMWLGVVITGSLFGRAARQGMYMGMVSPRDPNQEQSIDKGLRQQRAQGRLSAALLRWWPLPLTSVVAGIVVLAKSAR
jgi:hypothetical protein